MDNVLPNRRTLRDYIAQLYQTGKLSAKDHDRLVELLELAIDEAERTPYIVEGEQLVYMTGRR